MTHGSDGGCSTQVDSDVLKRSSLDRKTGDEKWRHAVVVGIPPGSAPWVLTPVYQLNMLRDAIIWDGVRLPRSVPVDSAATADRSVRGVFSPGELEEAVRSAAAQAVDSDAGARVSIPQRRWNSKTTVQGAEGDQPDCDKRSRSRRTRLEEPLVRRTGESTLVDYNLTCISKFFLLKQTSLQLGRSFGRRPRTKRRNMRF